MRMLALRETHSLVLTQVAQKPTASGCRSILQSMQCPVGSRRMETGIWRSVFCGVEPCYTHTKRLMVLASPTGVRQSRQIPPPSRASESSLGFSAHCQEVEPTWQAQLERYYSLRLVVWPQSERMRHLRRRRIAQITNLNRLSSAYTRPIRIFSLKSSRVNTRKVTPTISSPS